MKALHERHESLWVLALSPSIWAAHFLLSYVTAAIWCAKVVGRDGGLATVQVAVAVYTVLALAGIAFAGWKAWHRNRLHGSEPPHDADTPEDRYRFIGQATLLLSALSAVATIYVALVVLFVERCF